MPRAILLGMMIVVLGWALSGCRVAPQSAAPIGTFIQLQMGELYFKPEPIRLKAGETVQLELINEGQQEHEFMVGREVEMHQGQPDGYATDFFKGVKLSHKTENGKTQQESGHGTMVMLDGNSKATLTFKVPDNRKGEWEVGCFVIGHYQSGMKGKLIVE